MIRVVLADDQHLIRVGFRMVLDATDDIRVVGEAGDGVDAVRLARELAPDVVLMDVRMPVLNGVDATRRVVRSTAARVLILTTFDLDEYAYDGLRNGASGFLLKDVPPEVLLSGIRAVAAGDSVLSPRITRELVRRHAADVDRAAGRAADPERRGTALPDRLTSLTGREREVLDLVADGLSNAEIAGRLFVSEATVKTHVTRILAKLGLRDRVQAVIYSYEHGLRR